MRIFIGSDHAGFLLKEDLIAYLKEKGYEVLDMGTYSTESTDYPIYSAKVAKEVQQAEDDARGIVICGTGIGVSMTANRFNGVRAALCCSVEMAELARKHNNANILAIGARTTENVLAKKIVDAWLLTEFEGGRHQRRINLIDEI